MKIRADIEKVYFRDNERDSSLPTILKFQNVSLTAHDTIQIFRTKNLLDKSTALTFTTEDQIYFGFEDSGKAQLSTNNYFCSRNKYTNKIRILPIKDVKPHNYIYNDWNKKVANTQSTPVDLALKQFGGRRAKRVFGNRDHLAQNIFDAQNELHYNIKVSNLDASKNDSFMNYNTSENLRPPFNKNARNIADIYNPSEVVPIGLLEGMEDVAKVVYRTEVDSLPIKSNYLRRCLKTLQTSTPATDIYLQIKLIIYMDCLLNLIHTPSRNLANIQLSGITEKVENDIRKRFTDPIMLAPMVRTAFTAEKARCYFIVLALILNKEFEVNVNTISEELGISRKKVSKYGKIVFASVSGRFEKLSLKLPSQNLADNS